MKMTRRSVLSTALALPAHGRRSSASLARFQVESALDSSFDPWVEVNRTNLQHNVAEISRRVGARPILAVIKNNGYGLGVVNAGKLLETSSAIAGLAVVKLHEAMSLRDAGVRKPVLLMGPFDERNLADLIARDIMPMVYTPIGPALDRIAAARQKPTPLHVCIDTGIGRVGVPFRQAAPLVRDLAARKSVEIAGVMMTFTEDPQFDVEQLARFKTLCESLEHSGVKLGRKHAASSFALFQRPDAFMDMVRPGMAVFGAYSEPEFRHSGTLDLRPAVGLKTRVAYLKQLPKGDSAGYNRAYIAKDAVWVATLPVGHADGLPREAAQGARVRINGALYRIVATVSASHCIVELGAEQRVKIGDEATIFDWEEGSRPEDVNEACKTSVYDLTMHLNPLLPRRLVG
ncbi:MAG TPA: alanine racemase [Vicinamibacterales bacterium]|jgi:alanine racemase